MSLIPGDVLRYNRRPTARKKRGLETLPEGCDPHLNLLSSIKVHSPVISLVGVPELALYQSKTVSKVACALARGLHETSQAINDLLVNSAGHSKAILTIDYLLLQPNHGCEDFELFQSE